MTLLQAHSPETYQKIREMLKEVEERHKKFFVDQPPLADDEGHAHLYHYYSFQVVDQKVEVLIDTRLELPDEIHEEVMKKLEQLFIP